MSFDTRIPIYLQIMEKIKRDIITGQLKGGDKMPSVRTLAKELKVNVNTVQRVYQELERENVLYSQRGIGSFVTEDSNTINKIQQSMAYEVLSNFVKGMRELGFDTESMQQALEEFVKEEPNESLKY